MKQSTLSELTVDLQWLSLTWWTCTVSFAADAELTPILRLGAGATAGIIAMSATYPMDMVRGRLTVQVGFQIVLNRG